MCIADIQVKIKDRTSGNHIQYKMLHQNDVLNARITRDGTVVAEMNYI